MTFNKRASPCILWTKFEQTMFITVTAKWQVMPELGYISIWSNLWKRVCERSAAQAVPGRRVAGRPAVPVCAGRRSAASRGQSPARYAPARRTQSSWLAVRVRNRCWFTSPDVPRVHPLPRRDDPARRQLVPRDAGLPGWGLPSHAAQGAYDGQRWRPVSPVAGCP